MTGEKKNPWLDEGSRYSQDDRKRQKIRDMRFQDNSSHTIRILPSKITGGFPFFGYKQHWIPQNNTTVGKPITHGIDERCPVCDWVSAQWDEVHRLKEEEEMTDKSPEVKAILDKISKVTAKTRYDMNIIHREDLVVTNEETGEKTPMPKRMSAGYTVYQEIFSFAKKWGSPSNEETGYDLEISTSGSRERREYRVIPDRDASPLTADEKKLIEKGFDLEQLRNASSTSDIRKVLENAKSPYNEILSYVPDSEGKETTTSNSSDDVKAVEKEVEEAVKETKTKTETKPEAEPEPELEPESETQTADDSPVDDEHNIEVYECKGDFDENDKMCSDCPVKSACEDVHPYYVKAKQLKIDIDPHKPTTQVVDEVKKAEEPEASTASTSKRGKKIPF